MSRLVYSHHLWNPHIACRGWTVSVTQVLLMASPLSGLLRGVQQRSSANCHLGVCAMGLLSSSLWAIYAMVGPPALPLAAQLVFHMQHHSFASHGTSEQQPLGHLCHGGLPCLSRKLQPPNSCRRMQQ